MKELSTLDDKIRTTFGDFAVDKGLIGRLGIAGDDRHVPSYVMDWIVTRLSSSTTETTNLRKAVGDFVQKYLPAKGDKQHVKFRLSQGEILTILDAISVEVKLGREAQYFASIPCLDEKRVHIDASIISKHEGVLHGSMWGAIKIVYDSSEDSGGIRIVEFKPMQTGRISLDALFECRKAFSVEEWVDVLIRTMGYEPSKYTEEEKLWMLCRLIPVVHNRVNMMELAPPGTGKSYVYNNISRHVWLTSAQITPAVLFYNQQNKRPGLLTRYDLLVLDEAQSIKFTNEAEIQAQLKGYLEQGVYSRGDVCATAECGVMLLANIEFRQESGRFYGNKQQKLLPEREDYIRRLPAVFLEAPLLDRFHGIIPGWEIPPFSTEQQATGYGLKADYFAEVCHAMRSATHLSHNVRARLDLSGGKRDCTAVERLACGLAKLLLIDAEHPRFDELVVAPAKQMRKLVRDQLHKLDPQGFGAELTIRSSSVIGTIGHYDLLAEVGKGGMACVYKGRDQKTGVIVAIKMVNTADIEVDAIAMERENEIYNSLRSISNPHILPIFDVFSEDGKNVLVVEFADGGSLWDIMGGDMPDEDRRTLDERSAKEVALSILDGMVALHEKAIVHRDIKPQNILSCDDAWKIADFGISKLTAMPPSGYTFQGAFTAPWAPPEQISGVEAHSSADIYAFGKTMIFLLTGSRKRDAHAALPAVWSEILVPCVDDIPANRPDASSILSDVNTLNVAS